MNWISLGGNCSIAYQLKKHQLRQEAYPFDWCRISFPQLIHALQQNLKLFDHIYLHRYSEKHVSMDLTSGSYLIRNLYNIEFAHEVVKEDLLEFKECLQRRMIRFYKSTGPRTYIRLETSQKIYSLGELRPLLDAISSDYELIWIGVHPPRDRWEQVRYIPLEKLSEDWTYSHFNWNNIFNSFEKVES